MPDNKLVKSLLEDQKTFDTRPYAVAIKEATRASRSITDQLQSIAGENSALRQVMGIIRRNEEFTRVALGPLSELCRTGILNFDSPWCREMEMARQAIEGYQARFKLPEITETSRLLATFNEELSDTMSRYAETSSSLKRAMESMRTPWLDIQETMRSITGFADIQGIGRVLRTLPAFDETLTAALRVNLGDWRDSITWRPEVLTDLVARSDFSASLGFNAALTDFPLPAFEQSLDIAGLPRELLPSSGGQDAGTLRDGDEREEEELDRTNGAHNSLQRLERRLRKFIDEQMTQVCGPMWVKRRLPNGLYDEWLEKKQKAEQAGAEERLLIEYADFTDYQTIICRRDNWREVFGALFVRKESVRESFQRLYPIRLDVAHSRLITQDDELLLRVEVKRLMKVMARVW